MKTQIRLYSGSIGSGKTFVMTQHIEELKKFGNSILCVSFADNLKKFIKNFYGYNKDGEYEIRDKEFSYLNSWHREPVYEKSIEHFIDEYFNKRFYTLCNDDMQFIKNLFKELVPFEKIKELPIMDISQRKLEIRKMLQLIGTDIGHKLSKFIWVKNLEHYIKDFKGKVDYIFIDDWRFLSEYYYLLEHLTDCELVPYYVDCPIELRAKRKGTDIKTLKESESHISERESSIIRSLVEMNFSDNYIVNDEGKNV